MKFRVRLILCAIAFAIAISVRQILPQGISQLKAILFGHGDDPITQACIAFREKVSQGDDLKHCVYAFAQELNEKG